ncbi:MAG: sodium/proton-translocating pyrophosphatase, partial [Patescibacteria group bacterium]
MMTSSLLYIAGVSIIGILFSFWARRKVLQAPAGNEKMRQIAAAIEEGSRAYLKRQYRVVGVVAVVIAV